MSKEEKLLILNLLCRLWSDVLHTNPGCVTGSWGKKERCSQKRARKVTPLEMRTATKARGFPEWERPKMGRQGDCQTVARRLPELIVWMLTIGCSTSPTDTVSALTIWIGLSPCSLVELRVQLCSPEHAQLQWNFSNQWFAAIIGNMRVHIWCTRTIIPLGNGWTILPECFFSWREALVEKKSLCCSVWSHL